MTIFFPYAKQSISEEDIQAVAESLRQNLITRGEKVEEFEQIIANYCGAEYAVAFNSGSSALNAAYHAAKVTSYDRVITSPNTFVATIAEAWRRGAEPLFIDIDGNTGNIDLNLLAENLYFPSSRGRNIIVPVHFAGIPVNMKKLNQMIADPDTVIIEDAAHAFGSSYEDGQKVGSCAWSDMTIFSFHPAKNITTGEGGMVLTNDRKYFERLVQYRNNGISKKDSLSESNFPGFYDVIETTGNYHMTEMQAALGISQFNRHQEFYQKRKDLFSLYKKELEREKQLSFIHSKTNHEIFHHLCVLKVDFSSSGKDKKEFMLSLLERGIGTQVHYIPLYKHSFFKSKRPDISKYFPVMEEYYSQAVSLPFYKDLTNSDVKKIASEIRKVLKHKKI